MKRAAPEAEFHCWPVTCIKASHPNTLLSKLKLGRMWSQRWLNHPALPLSGCAAARF